MDSTDITGMDNDNNKPHDNTPNYYSGGVPTPPQPSENPYQYQQQPAQYPQSGPPQFSNPNAFPPAYQQMNNYGAMPPQAPTNKSAIISLVSSLVTLFLICWIPLIGLAGAIVGIVFGHKALQQIPDAPNSGRGIALTGTICGYVALLTTLGIHLIYLLMIIGIAAEGTTY